MSESKMRSALNSLLCLRKGMTATHVEYSTHLFSRAFSNASHYPCHAALAHNSLATNSTIYTGCPQRIQRIFCQMISVSSPGQCRHFHQFSQKGVFSPEAGFCYKNSRIIKPACRNSVKNPLYISSMSVSTKGTQYTATTGVLKSQSALQVKRPARKKLPIMTDEGKAIQINNVVAYAVADEIDLSKLEKHIMKQGLYSIGQLPQDVTSALHVRGKYNVDQRPKEIFVFEDGSVVFWCVPEVERGAFLKILPKYSQSPYLSSLVLFEKEEMDFTYVSGKTSLAGDIIQLKQSNDGDNVHLMLELYTFSNAMAQSVKLAIWEASFNKFVESIERVTEDLRHGRKISMSRRQVLMKTGELFSFRHMINLSSDLLDTPDFYWDREVLEPLYLSLCNYLNISRRTRVMNEKLNHCCELTGLLSSQLNDAHHTRLEVMIIVLILVEVVFEIVHFGERYLNTHTVEVWDQPMAGTEGGRQDGVAGQNG